MKTENLDALLLDHALGQLSPEVVELLDQHLARDPAAAARLASLRATVGLARDAVGLPANATDRISARSFATVRRSVWRGEMSREMLKAAACIAFGLGLGWAARSPAIKPDELSRTETARAIPSQGETPAAAFWSRERLEAEMRHAPRRRPPLVWPLAAPQRLEGKS